jgi:hypothetical protein
MLCVSYVRARETSFAAYKNFISPLSLTLFFSPHSKQPLQQQQKNVIHSGSKFGAKNRFRIGSEKLLL